MTFETINLIDKNRIQREIEMSVIEVKKILTPTRVVLSLSID